MAAASKTSRARNPEQRQAKLLWAVLYVRISDDPGGA